MTDSPNVSTSTIEVPESENPPGIPFNWYLLPTAVFTLLYALSVLSGFANAISDGVSLFNPSASGFVKIDWRYMGNFAASVGQIAVGILWAIAAVQWGRQRTYIATIISVLGILAALALPMSFIR